MKESIEGTRIGRNRTGMQMSPQHASQMLEGAQTDLVHSSEPRSFVPEGQELSVVRLDYIANADSLGSIPPPATVKGAAKSGAKMLKGRRLQAFTDKLAERLAFERGGTRLYDAVFAKAVAHTHELNAVSAQEIQEIRDSEARHALLVKECLESLGADPTAQTPSADLVGIQSSGLLQAASDPRTTLAQTLNTALAAELIDNAGWENLILMARQMGYDDMVERFEAALAEERIHLTKVKGWYTALTIDTGELM